MKNGDSMPAPMISITDMPKETTYVRVEEQFRKRVFLEAKENVGGTWKCLCKLLGVSDGTLRSYVKDKIAIPLSALYKICQTLNLKTSHLEKKVVWVGGHRGVGINNPRLPFNFNTPKGARFIMAILGDGSLGKGKSGGRPAYYNNDSKMRQIVIEAAREVLGDVDIYEHSKMIRLPRIVGQILNLLGIRSGTKAMLNPHIPKFILNSDKEVRATALRQILCDEGNVDPKCGKVKITSSIDAMMLPLNIQELLMKHPSKYWVEYVPNLLKDVTTLFKSFGITTRSPRVEGKIITKDKRVRLHWVLTISGASNYRKLLKFVGFDLKYKGAALREYLRSLTRVGSNEALGYSLVCAKIAQKKRGFFDKNSLSKIMKISSSTAKKRITQLKRNGFIRPTGEKERIIGCIYKPMKYRLTKKAEKTVKHFTSQYGHRCAPNFYEEFVAYYRGSIKGTVPSKLLKKNH